MSAQEKLDPTVLSLVYERLNAANLELGTRLFRQAFSVPTAHIRDLGCVIFDSSERVISIGNFMPVHTAGSQVSLKAMLDYIGRENINPDDLIVANHPFIVRFGHLADWSFLRPVFWKDKLVFYQFVRTHQYDSGGSYPGCYFPRTYDCHGEGVIIPPVKLVKGGKLDEDVHKVILANVRGAQMVRADNLLVYGAMKQVERRIISIIEDYGEEQVLAAINEIIDRTRRRVQDLIRSFPAGTYYAERAADWDGTTDRPVWVRLKMSIFPDKGKVVFDFTESDDQVDFINVPICQVWSSVVSAFLWCLPSDVPRNQGLLDCIEIVTREGSCLNPIYPATSGAQAVTLGQEIQECVMIAMAQVDPYNTPATWGRHVNPLLAGKRRDRIDPRTGHIMEYTAHTFHMLGSSGAVWGYDGVDGSGSAPLGGAQVRESVEVAEWMTPYRWIKYEFRRDSCGHGRWRGGLGTYVEIENCYPREVWQPLDCVIMSGNADGEKFGSVGFLGGTGGSTTEMEIIREGKRIQFRTMDLTFLQPGDRFIVKSGGGGGVGDPLEREIEKVAYDCKCEYISKETARDVCGVVITEEGDVDLDATVRLREEKRKQRKQK